jgi:hypothetical protein
LVSGSDGARVSTGVACDVDGWAGFARGTREAARNINKTGGEKKVNEASSRTLCVKDALDREAVGNVGKWVAVI